MKRTVVKAGVVKAGVIEAEVNEAEVNEAEVIEAEAEAVEVEVNEAEVDVAEANAVEEALDSWTFDMDTSSDADIGVSGDGDEILELDAGICCVRVVRSWVLVVVEMEGQGEYNRGLRAVQGWRGGRRG